MHHLIKNLRFTLRSLRKNPGFTAVALVTLSLGIGANTAIFSVVRGVLLSPLPYPDAEELVRVWPERPVSPAHLERFQDECPSFAAISGYDNASLSLVGNGNPEQLFGARVSAEHFTVLGVTPALGRAFAPEEEEPGNSDVVVLSHSLWQSRFAGDPKIVGRAITLDGKASTVIGVMPEDYQPMNASWQFWVPIVIDRAAEEYTDWLSYYMIARLAPDASPERAQGEIRAVLTRVVEEATTPLTQEQVDNATVVPVLERVIGDVRSTLWLLFGAVGLVLLIACSNVANLVLARANGRRREMALRSALGAGQGRLVSHLLSESLVLALVGGLLGLLAASWSVSALVGQLGSSLPRTNAITIDGGVFVFTLIASLFAGVLFGLLPAFSASRFDLRGALGNGDRGSTDRHRAHFALMTAEVALSAVLVIGAGLLVKSFWQVQNVDAGFGAENLLTFRVRPPATDYNDAARAVYFEKVHEELAAVPGVEEVNGINQMPLAGGTFRVIIGHPKKAAVPEEERIWTSVGMVTPGVMKTLRVPLLRGRYLKPGDHADAQQVGLINRTLAQQLWGDEDPIGQEMVWDTGESWFTVVGVVGDVRQVGLDAAAIQQVYRPVAQESWAPSMTYAIRASSGEPLALLPLIEKAVWSVNRNVPLTSVAMMDDVIARTLTGRRELAGLFALFAALALVLGAVGVYGVTAYTVSQRDHETGVRLALGATGASVVMTNLARAFAPVGLGLFLGAVGAAWLTSLLRGLLFEVEARDPMVFASVVGFVALAAGLAAFLPARRAARVDPMVVLGAD